MFNYKVFIISCLSLWLLSSTIQAKPLSIALVLWNGETIAEQSFKSELEQLGYQVTYEQINAEQSKKTLVLSVYDNLMPEIEKYDYIYTYGTTVSMLIKNLLQEKVPQIFNIVVAPVEAKLIESLQNTGGNISGASPAIDLALQLKNARKLFEFKRLGLFFNPRERNSLIIRQKLQVLAIEQGFKIIDLSLPPNTNQLDKHVQALKNNEMQLDAVYLPMDTFISTQAKKITDAMHSLNIKTIGANSAQLKQGILVGTIVDFAEMGRAAAQVVHQHQQSGTFDNIPVQLPQQPRFIINHTIAKQLNIGIPEPIQKYAKLRN
ncbi:ABC transporter substrate binding protein [Candidatus Albibeggiatoa sp. nov. BB20]|uniref:ABC transporter substrate binding protein n=1 Tax=Candidatus Albibeggiatoa sp. nov. BB20 TaxID=3162723 RepID=UPI003365817F